MVEAVRLQQEQVPLAARVLAESFVDDPITNYLFPDRQRRLIAMESIFGWYLKAGLQIGEVLTTSDIRGAAIWIRPSRLHPSQHLSVRFALQFSPLLFPFWFGPAAAMRMIRFSRFVYKVGDRSQLQDAWYLAVLGVDKTHRACGVGSGLLRPILQTADTEQRQCYLETSTERNIKFYKEHDFQITAQGTMSNNGLRLWLMVRDPRTK